MSLLTSLVLLYYSKAFNRINHNLSLATLHNISMNNNAMILLKNYINGRIRKVEGGASYSNACLVTSSVLQGSILGPLLCSLYISTFINCRAHYRSHFYAHDNQI